MVLRHVFSNAIADGTNTQIVRPSDWNSAHNLTQNLGGNTAGVSSVAGTDIVWAGGNNVTLSANGSTVSIHGADTTQFLTTAALSNHSHGNPTLALTNISGTTASNSAGLTLSLSGNDVTQFLTTAALSNHSHGNPTLALTNISGTTASNSAGLTLSLSAAGAGGGNTASFYENFIQAGANTGVAGVGSQSTHLIQPFTVAPISGNYLRLLGQVSANSTSFASSVNTSFTGSVMMTYIANIYSQMTGASSASLGLLHTMTAGYTFAHSLTANANGSEYSVSLSISYPITGGTSSFSTSYATTQTRFDLSTALATNFAGNRALDIPFNTSLPGSNYWLDLGRSISSATQVSAAQTNVFVLQNNVVFQSNQANATWAAFGLATNATDAVKPGLGSITTNASNLATIIPLNGISSGNNNREVYFQIIGRA